MKRYIKAGTYDTKLEKLANDLVQFYSDFDYYDYQDRVEDEEEEYNNILYDLVKGRTNIYIDSLEEDVIDEFELEIQDGSIDDTGMALYNRAKDLIQRLQVL